MPGTCWTIRAPRPSRPQNQHHQKRRRFQLAAVGALVSIISSWAATRKLGIARGPTHINLERHCWIGRWRLRDYALALTLGIHVYAVGVAVAVRVRSDRIQRLRHGSIFFISSAAKTPSERRAIRRAIRWAIKWGVAPLRRPEKGLWRNRIFGTSPVESVEKRAQQQGLASTRDVFRSPASSEASTITYCNGTIL